jgi:C4-dicarboxylate-specific signal transduction histidine kinase
MRGHFGGNRTLARGNGAPVVTQTAHRAQEALQATQAALAYAARVTTLGEMSASITLR